MNLLSMKENKTYQRKSDNDGIQFSDAQRDIFLCGSVWIEEGVAEPGL